MTSISVALGTYPHTAELKSGVVEFDGFTPDFVNVDGSIVPYFRRMVRNLEFDVAELAITTYLAAKEHHKPFTAIPVFPMREFPHRSIVVNVESGVSDPKDLEGKRVGLRANTVTTGVWARGVLADQYGVDLDKVSWVVADEDHVEECRLPPNVELIAGADLGSMVISGELAAGIGVVRTPSASVAPLIVDPAAKEAEWAARGIFPINHTVVVRDEILAEPGAPERLYNAFVRAKASLLAKLDSGVTLTDTEIVLRDRRSSIGPDPLPYGVEANRATLGTILDFSRSQHIVTKKIPLTELFVGGGDD